MAKKNKPDKLSQEVAQALAAGMSYGKWKAMQPIETNMSKKPDDMKKCEYCRKPFKAKPNKRFCDADCWSAAYKERKGRAKTT